MKEATRILTALLIMYVLVIVFFISALSIKSSVRAKVSGESPIVEHEAAAHANP